MVIYFRKEGRALGEVTKYLVYNAREYLLDVLGEIKPRTRALMLSLPRQAWNRSYVLCQQNTDRKIGRLTSATQVQANISHEPRT